MNSDDLTAVGGICAGALVSAALTFALMTAGPSQARLGFRMPALVPTPRELIVPPKACVGFAVPRVEPIVRVGPRTPSTERDGGVLLHPPRADMPRFP